MPTRSEGFSLVELLVSVAIIGIVSALAIPAYRTYIETANMSKVNAAYEHAVRLAPEEFVKNRTRVTMGLPATLPTNEEGWIDRLNKDDRIQAPGGGPAYVVKDGKKDKGKGKKKGKSKKKGKDKKVDDYGDPSETGAIALKVSKSGTRLDIYRPAYLGLKPFRARITVDDMEIKELKDK